MTDASELNPIFVHASPRGGSTYFFAVLRRIQSLMCYNESIIDIFGYYGKEGIARFKAGHKWNVNHHFLESDDFAEIVEAWDSVMHLYPMFPSFQDYLPPDGVLPRPLRAYLAALIEFAGARGKRAALCEVHSRGRAGALRDAFGGFHIAQYRDPISQFGSFFRPLPEGGQWNFLAFPLFELGISGNHPLYSIVPEPWRVPVLPWPADDRGQRWASATEYVSMVASPRPDTLQNVFRWHLFSWVLSNLAAVSYSDLVVDLDKAYDDSIYRRQMTESLATEIGATPDFSDLTRFSRYYRFESLDMAQVCAEVISVVETATHDGRIERAVATLSKQRPTVTAGAAVELLVAKIKDSLANMQASKDLRDVSAKEWNAIVRQNRSIWFNPAMRGAAQMAYPLGAPFVRIARQAGMIR